MDCDICDMFLEAFHSFKILYLHHKQIKHVHSLLVALIKIYRNTVFENSGKWKWAKTVTGFVKL